MKIFFKKSTFVTIFHGQTEAISAVFDALDMGDKIDIDAEVKKATAKKLSVVNYKNYSVVEDDEGVICLTINDDVLIKIYAVVNRFITAIAPVFTIIALAGKRFAISMEFLQKELHALKEEPKIGDDDASSAAGKTSDTTTK